MQSHFMAGWLAWEVCRGKRPEPETCQPNLAQQTARKVEPRPVGSVQNANRIMQSATQSLFPGDGPLFIATRGSALALAQASAVLAQCRAAFPALRCELKIIKTTGDKLQTAALAQEGANLPK